MERETDTEMLREVLDQYASRKHAEHENDLRVKNRIAELLTSNAGTMDGLCQRIGQEYNLPYDFVFRAVWEMIDGQQIELGDDRMLRNSTRGSY